jgi:hypothetical protein
VFDATYSHAFSFFLVCGLLALTDRWWAEPAVRTSVAMGVVAGLIVLVRHPNVIFLALVPLWGLQSWRDVRERAREVFARRAQIAVAAAAAVACLLPQVALYRAATGAWLVNAYNTPGLAYLASPRLFGVLFGFPKGLFLWSPVLLFAVAGMVSPGEWARRVRPGAAAVLAAQAYLVGSWFDWQFGGSFGHRAFTDAFGLFAPFLASFFAWAARHPRTGRLVATAVSLAVLLSVAQMAQYWMGILPASDVTWEQYRQLFLRFR